MAPPHLCCKHWVVLVLRVGFKCFGAHRPVAPRHPPLLVRLHSPLPPAALRMQLGLHWPVVSSKHEALSMWDASMSPMPHQGFLRAGRCSSREPRETCRGPGQRVQQVRTQPGAHPQRNNPLCPHLLGRWEAGLFPGGVSSLVPNTSILQLPHSSTATLSQRALWLERAFYEAGPPMVPFMVLKPTTSITFFPRGGGGSCLFPPQVPLPALPHFHTHL